MPSRQRPSVHIPPVAVPPAQTSALQRRQQLRLYPDLRPASVLSAPLYCAQHPPVSVHPSGPDPTRKPAFQVFCDTVPSDLMSSNPNNGRCVRSAVASLDSCASLQTVVNNKENQVPEFEGKVLPNTRPSLRDSNRLRVLGEKQPLSTGRQCLDKWNGKVPFAPCSPEAKPRRSILQDCPKTRSIAKANKQVVDPNKPQSSKHHALTQTRVNARLSKLDSALYVPDVGIDQSPLPKARAAGHTVTLEINSLVAKLEALETSDLLPEEDVCELSEPLPDNATCPGAPKLPASFTMPVFDAGEDDEAQEIIVEPKSPNFHQMSPLAEVTEAYTGLQGGWSPPLETLSPALGNCQLSTMQGHLIPASTENHQPKPAAKDHKISKMTEPTRATAPRPKRRRELVPSVESSGDHPPFASAKGPLRI